MSCQNTCLTTMNPNSGFLLFCTSKAKMVDGVLRKKNGDARPQRVASLYIMWKELRGVP